MADAAAVITAGRVQRHVQLLSILWFVYSFFSLLEGGVLLVLANTLFVYIGHGDMQRIPGFLQPLLSFIGIMFLAKALAGFAAGWGLLQRERWARPVALVLGFLSLLHPPFGTALGIYTLWVLLPSQAGDEYGGLTAQPVSEGQVSA